MDIKKLVRRILSEQPGDEVAPIPQPQLTKRFLGQFNNKMERRIS